MVAAAPVALSLAELQEFDPHARMRDGETDFCCPLCGQDKRRNAAHRSLSVNTQTGLWECHRCRAKGRLREKWEERRPWAERPRVARRVRDLPASEPKDAPDPAWRSKLAGLVPLAGTPGASYLAGRGIPPELAHAAGVRYHAAWYGRPAVVFPFRDRKGALVAAQGRCVDGKDPGKLSAGPIGQGVFPTPGALDAKPLVIVEAPLDALSLALTGLPALALAGTQGKPWLPRLCALRPVLLALDADAAGEQGCDDLRGNLEALGAHAERLRPAGAKDWNDILRAGGVEALRAAVAPVLAGMAAVEALDRCAACGAPVFAFTPDGRPYCEAHAPQYSAPNNPAPGTSARCPVCLRILTTGHARCPGACELREVASCRDYPAAGTVAPLEAPAGTEYEPGQDWPAEENAPARVPVLVYLPGEEPAWCARCGVELVNLRAPDGLCGPCRWQEGQRLRGPLLHLAAAKGYPTLRRRRGWPVVSEKHRHTVTGEDDWLLFVSEADTNALRLAEELLQALPDAVPGPFGQPGRPARPVLAEE